MRAAMAQSFFMYTPNKKVVLYWSLTAITMPTHRGKRPPISTRYKGFQVEGESSSPQDFGRGYKLSKSSLHPF